ncbi:class II aldolase and Adducin N-terminal domain-containing protein [Paraphoma chrysanthemicola]|uniref:Class II aldolase and Adducin N-terminal domain-containing protein n=1 Tax=Paraphoma chrysanthemicola TaxID=798071 RepID=A0A8K0RI81_9PLEO|nr:class II aldolase and Adducin N-terminal domain-containing protein [Paraphoma chrysanthemicola]
MALPPAFHQQLRLLIRANHILHQHGLVDAFGHISIRHPMNRSQYIIAAYDPGAPALVKSRADFIAYHISDSSPVDPDAPQGYSERFIHGEVLKKFPEVMCVIHSHSEAVIPFTLGGVAVRPVFHMAGFLGPDPVAISHNFGHTPSGETSRGLDMLVKSESLGSALASKLSLDRPVVLQHKHGFTTFGTSIEQALYRAIYTQTNCQLLSQAILLAGGDAEKVAYLNREEASACRIMNEKCEDKSFRLWLREVQANSLYENEEGEPEKGKVAGMEV